MLVKPNFYDNFICIADKCPDTCCAGWEIDVDGDTADYYSSMEGEDSEFINPHLIRCEDGSISLCREGERCPFLQNDNLCALILRFGDTALCDICREHPRFYSGTDGITEAGMGLCCPEAARLWLSVPCEFTLTDDGEAVSDAEKKLLDRQMALINKLAVNGTPFPGCLTELIGDETCGSDTLYSGLLGLYASLEALDPSFPHCFCRSVPTVRDERYRNLAAYFIFRYYFELGEELCLKFTAVSLAMIAAMGGELTEAAKNYSKEVEYDTDNLERIYDFIETHSGIAALLTAVFGG